MSEQAVSERIKLLLDKYAYGNKAAMGRSLGISGQAIADLIEGKKGGPSFPVLQKMLTIYSDIRAEWLVLGEEPMLKTKVLLTSGQSAITVSNPIALAQNSSADIVLTPEQWAQIAAAAVKTIMESEEMKDRMAVSGASGEANAKADINIYWIGKPDPTRPYNGLLTERLGISEEEAKQLVLSGELPAGKFGKSNRITNYRISERAVKKFLDGMSGDQQRAEYNKSYS